MSDLFFYMNDKWRVIDTGVNPAYVNMAIDEALLDYHIFTNNSPVLRFYNWEKPSLSLGRNQNLKDINLEACKKLDIDIVRRPTGGNAVFNNKDLTYSLISGFKDGFFSSIIETYQQINMALITGLQQLDKKLELSIGIETGNNYFNNANCFSTSTIADLNYGDLKVVGNSLLRRKQALLIHGEIMIGDNFSLYPEIFNSSITTEKQTSIKAILGYEPSLEKIRECIIYGFEKHFKIILKKSELYKPEIKLSQSNYKKYQTVITP